MTLPELLSFYEGHLREQVMPFWTRHCIDRNYGGVTNCVADDGALLSTNKFIWSQGRALWTFSALYHRFEQNPEWLHIADAAAQFLMQYGRDSKGAWVFCLHRDGSVAEPAKSIYADLFALLGLTEYAATTGNEQALDAALQTYRRTSPLLRDHSTLPTAPLPIPRGLQAHGPSMVSALAYHELGLLTDDRQILERALELAEIVMTQHLKPERQLLYEFVRAGGALADGDAGQTFVPGHAIESMWIMERIYAYHQRPQRIVLAMQAIRWHLEKCWDDQYGGIFLACHAGGGTPIWIHPSHKAWWTATEALYALLRAHEVTGEPWCFDWYWRLHDYAFRVYPDRDHGDWHQTLDREGKIVEPLYKNMAVKDPFHLPRALLLSIEALRRLTSAPDSTVRNLPPRIRRV